jgi:predicted negative regulator of RcsB-dependent stress response
VDEYLSEKEQWEAVKTWLRENGLWIIGGVALAAVGISGWRWYQARIDASGAQASAQYTQMLQAFGKDDSAQAFVALGTLERDFPGSPYVDQAKLAAARSYVESNQLDKAANELQTVAEHTKDKDLGMVARLRLARVQIAQKKPELAIGTLNAMQPGAFAARFHEVMGDALYAKGDKPGALKEYITARAADLGSGTGGGEGLELKITDLSATAAPPTASNLPAPNTVTAPAAAAPAK